MTPHLILTSDRKRQWLNLLLITAALFLAYYLGAAHRSRILSRLWPLGPCS